MVTASICRGGSAIQGLVGAQPHVGTMLLQRGPPATGDLTCEAACVLLMGPEEAAPT